MTGDTERIFCVPVALVLHFLTLIRTDLRNYRRRARTVGSPAMRDLASLETCPLRSGQAARSTRALPSSTA